MAWVKVDDGFPNNAKVEPLSDRAFRLHVAGMCYSARNLTDGIISPRSVTILRAETKATNKHAAELITAGLWDVVDEGYSIHDYLEYNPTGDEARSVKEARKEAGRLGGLRSGQSRRREANGQANGQALASKQNGKQPGSSTGGSTPSRPVLKDKDPRAVTSTEPPAPDPDEANSPGNAEEELHPDVAAIAPQLEEVPW